jgi:hypothetical protein
MKSEPEKNGKGEWQAVGIVYAFVICILPTGLIMERFGMNAGLIYYWSIAIPFGVFALRLAALSDRKK